MLLGSYLLGAFPQVYLLGRLRGIDLRRERDLHIGLWLRVSRVLGFIGVAVDVAKGVTVILVGRALVVEPWAVALASLLVVVGQMWPVFLLGTGGRGNSVGLGVALALTLTSSAFLIALVPAGLGALIRTVPRLIKAKQFVSGPPSRSLPVGVILGFALLPVAAWWWGVGVETVLIYGGLFLVIVARRLTVGLGADLKRAQDKKAIFWNRFLYDRSFL